MQYLELKNKAKKQGLRVTKTVKGKRVKLTPKELRAKISMTRLFYPSPSPPNPDGISMPSSTLKKKIQPANFYRFYHALVYTSRTSICLYNVPR